MTQLKTLDLSKLPKLKCIHVCYNNIQNIKMRDLQQINQLTYVCIDYNLYSSMFFNEFSIENFKGKIQIKRFQNE